MVDKPVMKKFTDFFDIDSFLFCQTLMKVIHGVYQLCMQVCMGATIRIMDGLHQVLLSLKMRMGIVDKPFKGIFKYHRVSMLDGNFILIDQNEKMFVIFINKIVSNG